MFPLIPALLLLLLQGHLANERGMVSANLDALPWGAVARKLEGDPNLARKLTAEARAWLWLLSQPSNPEAQTVRETHEPTISLPSPEFGTPEGYRRSDRTRDGPVNFA